MGWKKAAGVLIANFHQFALRILRRHYSEIGFKNQFMVLGAKDQRDVIEECVAKYEKTCRKGELVASMTQANNENGEEEDQVIEMMIGSESKGSSSKSKKNNTTSSRVVNYFVNFIRKAKRQQKSPKDFEDHAHCTIYKHYIDELRNRQAIDFSDMIPLTLHLFNKRADILKQTRQNFKYVFVDEFQDLSKDQFELMRLIASDGGHLTVCGDDDQSIYGWRGATVQGFDLFAKTFKDHQIVVLNQTFRNTKTIVAAVSSLIKKNKKRREKVLWTENGRGEMIDFKVLRDRHKEAQTVIDEIKLRMNKFGLRYKAFAILTRTRRALKATSECLKRNQIPYKNSAATSKPFGQTKQVLDLIAYLDLVAKDDDKAFERVINTPKRGLGLSVLSNVRELANSVGKSYMKAARMAVKSKLRGITARGVTALRKFILTMSNFREYSQGRPIRDILDNIITTIGYYSYIQKSCSKVMLFFFVFACARVPEISCAQQTDELEHKMGAVKRLLQRAAGYDNTNHSNPSLKLKDRIRDFTRQIKRKENEKENASDHVTLSTIHQAKGLEWPVVFLIHFNDGILPLPPRTDDKAKELLQIEEERRLAYVAMSRAKLKLCIRCIQRDEMGTPLLPSRFLDDVPQKLLGDCDEKQSTTTNKTPSHKGSTAPSETPAYGVKNHLSPLHAANEGLDHTLSRDSKEPFVKASKLLKEKRENNLSVVSPTNRNDVIPLQGKAAICSLSQTVSRKVKNTSKLKKGKGEKHHRKNCKSKKRTSTGSVLGFRI